MKKNINYLAKHPVAIGGIGGSGTRLVANIVRYLGYHIGSDLNVPLDNLWFTFLFRRPELMDISKFEIEQRLEIFISRMKNIPNSHNKTTKLIDQLSSIRLKPFPPEWPKARAKTLTKIDENLVYPYAWGWKEPNTHILINNIMSYIPNIKYIHVMRNGLDMAFSKNQNQARMWGKHYLGEDFINTPAYSLRYWRITHERITGYLDTYPDQIYILNYDKLCESPLSEIAKILKFLEFEFNDSQLDELSTLVSKPNSTGRFKTHNISDFDLDDVRFVKNLGFNIN